MKTGVDAQLVGTLLLFEHPVSGAAEFDQGGKVNKEQCRQPQIAPTT